MLRKLTVSLACCLMILGVASVSFPSIASAAVASHCRGSFLGFPMWYKYLDVGTEEYEDSEGDVIVTDPCAITGPKVTRIDARGNEIEDWDLAAIIPRVALAGFEILLRIATLVAAGYVLYGGFRFITSQGDPESAKSARQTIINAVIGLVIALLAAAIVSFMGTALTRSSSPSGGASGGGGAVNRGNAQQAE